MADIADLAQDHMEAEAPYILARARRPAGPVPNGHCHYCEEPVVPDVPFCDADCRDDWQRLQHAQAQRPVGDD
jgi:hypothetical protein